MFRIVDPRGAEKKNMQRPGLKKKGGLPKDVVSWPHGRRRPRKCEENLSNSNHGFWNGISCQWTL